jgi:hypothetical protein
LLFLSHGAVWFGDPLLEANDGARIQIFSVMLSDMTREDGVFRVILRQVLQSEQ